VKWFGSLMGGRLIWWFELCVRLMDGERSDVIGRRVGFFEFAGGFGVSVLSVREKDGLWCSLVALG